MAVKGAHEWRYPVKNSEGGSRHSIERNLGIIFDLILEGRLKVEPLLSRIAKPEDAPQYMKRSGIIRTILSESFSTDNKAGVTANACISGANGADNIGCVVENRGIKE